MDKREAIRIFVRRNPKIFMSSPFPYDVFKRSKREFFLKHERMGVKDSEIASELISMMIGSSQIKTADQLRKVLSYPFFAHNLHNKEYYYQKLSLQYPNSETIFKKSKSDNRESPQQITANNGETSSGINLRDEDTKIISIINLKGGAGET
jgi:hypothetical protein